MTCLVAGASAALAAYSETVFPPLQHVLRCGGGSGSSLGGAIGAALCSRDPQLQRGPFLTACLSREEKRFEREGEENDGWIYSDELCEPRATHSPSSGGRYWHSGL